MNKFLAILLLVVMPFIGWGAVYQTVMVDSNRYMKYPSNGFASITINGSTITSWTNLVVTNTLVSSNWAVWAASTNVDMVQHAITNTDYVSANYINITSANVDYCVSKTSRVSVIKSASGVLLFED